jgi:hypothetical protein
MFHGPAYQGIVHLDALGDDGIRGDIETGAARGALLDNAGQLFGYWVMARYTSHRLAMPIGLRRVELFGPHPQPGERLTCTVRIRHVDDGQVGADLCLARGGRSWARIQGWEDRRFDTEGRLWPVLLWPEKNTLAEPLAPGMAVFVDRHGSAPTREQLARRFLTEAERAAYERVPPRSQRAWLSTRIAAKDAVRSLLLPGGDVFPAEVTLHDGEGGALVAHGPRGFRCAVATAARGDLYAAAAGRAPVLVAEDAARAPADLDDGEARLGAGEDAVAFARRVATARATVAAAFGSGAGALPPRARDRGDARLLLGDSWAHVTRYRDTLFGWMGTGT